MNGHQMTLPGTPQPHTNREPLWLIPRGNGYAVKAGAAGPLVGYIERQAAAWRITRIDLLDATFDTATEAAEALAEALQQEGSL